MNDDPLQFRAYVTAHGDAWRLHAAADAYRRGEPTIALAWLSSDECDLSHWRDWRVMVERARGYRRLPE